jgi:hypothetical protein
MIVNPSENPRYACDGGKQIVRLLDKVITDLNDHVTLTVVRLMTEPDGGTSYQDISVAL